MKSKHICLKFANK